MLFLSLFLILFFAAPIDAAITFFGGSSIPATDPGDVADDIGPLAITPPASMLPNDFVIVMQITQQAAATSMTHSNPTTGGQTWSHSSNCVGPDVFGGGTPRASLWTAKFDGTWTANPAFDTTNGGGSAETLVMLVFRGVDTSTAIDVTAICGQWDTAGEAPNDVTISAITTNTNNAMALAIWTHIADVASTWTIQTGGWTQSTPAQFRNTTGNDMSTSYAYKIQASAGTTGDVVNQESSNAGGVTWILALKEAATLSVAKRQIIIVQ
jgi:hypothetical protein